MDNPEFADKWTWLTALPPCSRVSTQLPNCNVAKVLGEHQALPGIERVIALRMPAAGRRRQPPAAPANEPHAGVLDVWGTLTAQSAGGTHPVDRGASIGGSLTALSACKRTPRYGFVGLGSLCRCFRCSAKRTCPASELRPRMFETSGSAATTQDADGPAQSTDFSTGDL